MKIVLKDFTRVIPSSVSRSGWKSCIMQKRYFFEGNHAHQNLNECIYTHINSDHLLRCKT
jgi:hypothetical protein